MGVLNTSHHSRRPYLAGLTTGQLAVLYGMMERGYNALECSIRSGFMTGEKPWDLWSELNGTAGEVYTALHCSIAAADGDHDFVMSTHDIIGPKKP